MARTGPRRNRFTGPTRPATPPGKSHNDHEAELPPAKRRKLNPTFQQYETPQKAQVHAIVA